MVVMDYNNILKEQIPMVFVLPDNHIQEEMSRAYIKAVCNHAGYVLSLPERDYGLDVNVREVKVKQNGTSFSYRFTGSNIDIQLKSTIRYSEDTTHIIYDLDAQAYNDLVEIQETGTKRILVLLLLPKEKSEWISQCADSLALKKCAYWASLEGLTAETVNIYTKRIKIPKTHIFSPEALNRVMQAIKDKEDLSNV